MKKFSAWILFICGINLCLAGTAKAALMAIWDFGPNQAGYTTDVTNEDVDGIPTFTMTGGIIDPDGADGTSYTDTDGVFHNDGQSAEYNNCNSNSQWIITINTTGWEDISIRWDYWSENDVPGDDLGPPRFDFDYNIGGQWHDIVNNQFMIRDTGWHIYSKDLSLFPIENLSLVQLRINDLSGGDESGGNYRIDNIEITGNVVPEPMTISLLAVGLIFSRRRKIK